VLCKVQDIWNIKVKYEAVKQMTWDNFLAQNITHNYDEQVKTDIDCPKCGKKIYFDTTVVLTSYPPQYKYWCDCGWCDNAYVKWVKN